VDAQADRHHPLGNREERPRSPRQHTAREGDTVTATSRVRESRKPFHLVKRIATLGSCSRHPEHKDDPGNPPPLVGPIFWRTRDVVGDENRACVDATVAEASLCLAEVKHIPRVSPEREEHAAAIFDGLRDSHGLARRRRREDVSTDRARSEAVSNEASERRVVTGSAPDDDRDLSRAKGSRAHHSAINAPDLVGVGEHESRERVVDEGVGVGKDARHYSTPDGYI